MAPVIILELTWAWVGDWGCRCSASLGLLVPDRAAPHRQRRYRWLAGTRLEPDRIAYSGKSRFMFHDRSHSVRSL